MKTRQWTTIAGNALADQLGYTYDALGNLVTQTRIPGDTAAITSDTYTRQRDGPPNDTKFCESFSR
jgi:YD repeat-containing protein